MVGEFNATVTELRDRLVGVAQIPGEAVRHSPSQGSTP